MLRTAGRVRSLHLGNVFKQSEQSYTLSKKFDHPQSLVYQLISEVDKYHEFIPYCTDSFVRARDENSQPTTAGLRVGFREFEEEFTCDLQCKKPELVVAKSITHSLFKSLLTEWTVHSLGNEHCKAVLRLEYEFKNELYNQMSSFFATKVANLMFRAFEKRAYELAHSSSENK
ncbi:hypothetical protein OGAPHI_003733 [Ogataea philodendri]|uniref:Coenzyme Q-binding protein COQ10 START domain-containing protein n=1 Tax=Ogataea philodendri TaxID=1378263 RepID=A0A9P8P5Y0_9ASCO|nr:uncharacterized protein OGAPHI_003733 [Ogataea philodendri]KAH3665547.1 hypothetical protein OGAPHI_003733 [Ogataea philodendri]